MNKYLIVAFFAIILGAGFAFATSVGSTSGEFNASSSPLNFNWTNGYKANMTIQNNENYSIAVNVTNITGLIINSIDEIADFKINNSTAYVNESIYISNESTRNIILEFDLPTNSGRYTGNISILNNTNSSENIADFNLILDVPMNFTTDTIQLYGNGTQTFYLLNESLENVVGIVADSNVSTTMSFKNQAGTTLASSSNLTHVEYFNNAGLSGQHYAITVSASEQYDVTFKLVGYNITIDSAVSNKTLTGVLNTNDTMIVNVTPRFFDGTFITGLNRTNFTVWLTQEIPGSDTVTRNLVVNSSYEATGYYLLNVTSSALYDFSGGDYAVNVKVTAGQYGQSLYGTETFENIIVNNSALVIKATADTNTEDNLDVGEDFEISVNVSNIGTQNLTNVRVKLLFNDCSGELVIHENYLEDDTSDIADFGVLNASTWKEDDVWLIDVDGVCDDTIEVVAYGTTNEKYEAASASISVDVNEDEDADPSSSTTVESSGEMTIYSWPQEITAARGIPKNVIVKVKNTMPVTMVSTTLHVLDIPTSWYTITPLTQNVARNEIKEFTVTFNIPSTEAEGTKIIKFKVNRTNSNAITDTESSNLIISNDGTTPEEKLATFRADFTELLATYNQTKAAADRLTEVDTLLGQIENLIKEADDYVTAGNYTEADKIFEQIDDKLKEATDKMNAIRGAVIFGDFGDYAPFVGFVAAIGVVALVIYLRNPPAPSGFNPGVGYRHVPTNEQKGTRLNRIKNKLKEMFGNNKGYQYKP